MHKMLKPYKDVEPLITVNKIRSILSDLGIFVTGNYMQDGEYYTCRIEIVNDGLLKYRIGSFGKGLSLEYSCASAYAEFMERLQNNVLFKNTFFFSKYYDKKCAFKTKLKSENLELEFLYCPDEKLSEMSEVVDNNFELLSRSFFLCNSPQISRT
jgi:ribosomal protein S12 methylthiotransferase accessory factor